MRALKLYNSGDWDGSGGHLFVAAWSQQDAVALVNQAHKKLMGYDGNMSLGHFREYWNKGCWGNDMNDVKRERGVWWAKRVEGGWHGKPERVI